MDPFLRTERPSYRSAITHPTLAMRRRLARLRRIVTAMAFVAALLLPARLAITVIPSSSVVVAGAALRAGRILTSKDVAIRDVPRSGVLPGMSSERNEVVGRTLLADVLEGEPLSHAVLTESPSVPQGYAALEVPVIGTGRGITPGDRLVLLSDGECRETDRQEGLCPVSDKAIVLDLSAKQQDTTFLSLALPAAEALRVTRMSGVAPMVAISPPSR
ncbi:SAF domain-containing protein [uncultured Bifidobacterium sp.]|uniref:SAF domain-containing protein n=1 Tax=uncultured Bifidobacterium sp. TaxID=165187 RepID=UPI0028DC67B2|nr:SAF domain-containing protein [uncultured Bifidobacterium sp.]